MKYGFLIGFDNEDELKKFMSGFVKGQSMTNIAKKELADIVSDKLNAMEE